MTCAYRFKSERSHTPKRGRAAHVMIEPYATGGSKVQALSKSQPAGVS